MLLFPRLFLLFPGCALAEDAAPVVSGSSYLQALLALSIIVLLLVGLAWLARKVSGGKGFGQGGMKIIGGVALSPRERLVLVEVGDTWLVIGVVPGQIRTLHRLPKGEMPAADNKMQDISFPQWLTQVTRRVNDQT